MLRPTRIACALAIHALAGLALARPDPLPAILAACGEYRYREVVRMIDALAPAALDPGLLRYRGLALMKMGRWEESVQTLERAAAAAPEDVEIQVDLAGAYGQLALASGPFGKISAGRKSRLALERAVALGPGNVDARNGLFGFYLNVPAIAGGGRDKALAQLAEIERLDPIAGRVGRAEVAYADKDYARSLAIYREVQRAHPGDFRGFYGFGRVAALSGQELTEGLAALRRCLTMTAPLRMPGWPGVYLRIGDILRRQGDRSGAREAYRASLKILPEYPFAREELEKLGSE
jgi:tetratricopeptide (TPR) repeat protein